MLNEQPWKFDANLIDGNLMNTRVLSGLALAFLLPSLAVAGENWPEFRGPTADGHSDSIGLPVRWSESENIAWKRAIHGRAWSSPVIWENRIWLTTATPDGKELFGVCIDRETGAIVHDVKLFDVAEPREIHVTNTYASSTPAIEAGRVYLHFGSYGTACLDSDTAKVLWTRRDLPCHHWRGPGSSPILFRDMLIVHFDGYDYQYVVALDKQTGETVWKSDRNIDYGTDNGDYKKAYGTPIVIEVAGRPQLISAAAKAALAYDPFTGDELWKIRYGQHSTATRPLFVDGLLYINSGFSKAELFAVRPDGSGDVTDTHVVWKLAKGVPSKPSQLLIDGLIYMINDAGVATCVEAASGEQVWQQRLGGKFSSSPIYADGRIYMSSHEGTTTVIEAGRQFKKLAENRLDSGFQASPAVSGKALYLRSETHLYRIEEGT